MAELLRSTDMVLLSFVTSLLSDAGISMIIADTHVSAVEGSIGAFPRRVLVPEEELRESVSILIEAGLGKELRPGAMAVGYHP